MGALSSETTEKIRNEVMAATQSAFSKAFPPEKVAKELAILAFSDMANFIDSDQGGDYVKSITTLKPKKNSKAVKKLKVKQLQPVMQLDGTGELIARETVQTEIELYDKLAAFKLAIDVMGWNATQKHEVGFTEETLKSMNDDRRQLAEALLKNVYSDDGV